jgi:hypothetical protein
MPGNQKDCTGVIACPFGVNRAYIEPAERATLTIGDDSVDCHLCAIPTCSLGTNAFCEPVTHQCMILAEAFDAGPIVTGTGGTTTTSTTGTAGSGYDSGAL